MTDSLSPSADQRPVNGCERFALLASAIAGQPLEVAAGGSRGVGVDRRPYHLRRRGSGAPDPVAMRRGAGVPPLRGELRTSSSSQVGPEAVRNSALPEPRRTPRSGHPLRPCPGHRSSRNRPPDGTANRLSAVVTDVGPRVGGDPGPSGRLWCDSPPPGRARPGRSNGRTHIQLTFRHRKGKHFSANSRTTSEKARSSTFSRAPSVEAVRSDDSSSGCSVTRGRRGAEPQEQMLRLVSPGAVPVSRAWARRRRAG